MEQKSANEDNTPIQSPSEGFKIGCFIFLVAFFFPMFFGHNHHGPSPVHFRVFWAIWGSGSLLFYGVGIISRSIKPQSELANIAHFFGKSGMTINAIYGYHNWLAYAETRKSMTLGGALLHISIYVAGGVFLYFIVSRTAKRIWVSIRPQANKLKEV